MGAFGELLIQMWGGNLDRYMGNTKPRRKERRIPTKLTKYHKEILSRIKSNKSVGEMSANCINDLLWLGYIKELDGFCLYELTAKGKQIK